MVVPRQIWTMWVGSASPTMAPAIAQVEAINAIGMVNLKLARLALSSPGPAAKAPRKGHEQPGAADKVEVERKEAADDRYKEHAAAHAPQHREDSHNERHDKQDQGPNPPSGSLRTDRPSCNRFGVGRYRQEHHEEQTQDHGQRVFVRRPHP